MLDTLGSIFHAATEVPRGVLEYREFQQLWPQIKDRIPDGKGQPVLVLPGFMIDDPYMKGLRDALKEKNYNVYEWEGGLNFGFDEGTARHLKKQLKRIHDETDQKVSIIGYSLGGYYARELKREYPCWVDKAFTMGTPFGMGGKKKNPIVLSVFRKVYKFINPKGARLMSDEEIERRFLTPPGGGPNISLVSKTDAVADWKSALNPEAPRTENIEINSSHTGMPWNIQAVVAILDVLSRDSDKWRAFEPRDYPVLNYPRTIRKQDLPKNPEWHYTKSKHSPFFRTPRCQLK